MQRRSRRRAVTIGAVVVACFAQSSGVSGEEQRSEIEIDAQRVEVDQQEGEALFIGGVLLRHGEVELRCNRLRARVDGEGRVVGVDATGAVSVSARGLQATATMARYEPRSGRVTLSGGPRVTSAAGVITGRVMVIDVHTGRVSIEEAHGVFRIGS